VGLQVMLIEVGAKVGGRLVARPGEKYVISD
jgi:hypothetical protein